MLHEGVKVEIQGFEMRYDQEDQLKSLIKKLRELSPISQPRLRFIKNNRFFEGMVWCHTLGIPIGAYNRCASFSQLTKSLLKKVSKEYRKIHKLNATSSKTFKSKAPANESNYDLAS